MSKATKYVLVSVAIMSIGLVIVSVATDSWLPIGIGLSILGIFGVMFGPLLSTL